MPPATNVVPLRRGWLPDGAKLPGPSPFAGEPSALLARIALLWGRSFDALALVDDDRRYVFVNGPTIELLGATREEILEARIDEFTPPELWPSLDELWDKLTVRGLLEGPYEMLRGDGARSLIEFRATRDFAPGAHLIIAREIVARLGAAPGRAGADARRLTPREREILQLAADGGSTQAIADILVISPRTVKTHFEHIYKKLDVRDRGAAVAEGFRRGLIE